VPRAAAAGVRKAPRHEIAGETLCWAVPRAQLSGFERRGCRVHAGREARGGALRGAKHAGGFASGEGAERADDGEHERTSPADVSGAGMAGETGESIHRYRKRAGADRDMGLSHAHNVEQQRWA
jgi:hypothetical protein